MFAAEAYVKHTTEGWSGLVIASNGDSVTVDERGTTRTVPARELYEPLAAMCGSHQEEGRPHG